MLLVLTSCSDPNVLLNRRGRLKRPRRLRRTPAWRPPVAFRGPKYEKREGRTTAASVQDPSPPRALVVMVAAKAVGYRRRPRLRRSWWREGKDDTSADAGSVAFLAPLSPGRRPSRRLSPPSRTSTTPIMEARGKDDTSADAGIVALLALCRAGRRQGRRPESPPLASTTQFMVGARGRRH